MSERRIVRALRRLPKIPEGPEWESFKNFLKARYADCLRIASDLMKSIETPYPEITYQMLLDKLLSPFIYIYDEWTIMGPEQRMPFATSEYREQLTKAIEEGRKVAEEAFQVEIAPEGLPAGLRLMLKERGVISLDDIRVERYRDPRYWEENLSVEVGGVTKIVDKEGWELLQRKIEEEGLTDEEVAKLSEAQRNILNTMCDAGFLYRDQQGRYHLVR